MTEPLCESCYWSYAENRSECFISDFSGVDYREKESPCPKYLSHEEGWQQFINARTKDRQGS